MEATQSFVDCCGHGDGEGELVNQVTIATQGMSCTGCESRIEQALGRLEGVRRVKADQRASRVEVAFDQEVDEAVIHRRIEELGYEVTR